MKLHQLLLESVTLDFVKSRFDLIDPKTDKYYTGEVNVDGSAWITHTSLTKLPVKFGTVKGDFFINRNELTSLKNSPRKVNGNFSCSSNELTSLEGAPQEIGHHFICSDNRITSLEGIHKIIKRIDGEFVCTDNPISSGGIGLLLIEGIDKIYPSSSPVFKIINKYFGQGKKGLLACQEELIEAGLEEFAKL